MELPGVAVHHTADSVSPCQAVSKLIKWTSKSNSVIHPVKG